MGAIRLHLLKISAVMEILAVLFFLFIAGMAFFTLIFLSLFLPYWIGSQVYEALTHNPEKKADTE